MASAGGSRGVAGLGCFHIYTRPERPALLLALVAGLIGVAPDAPAQALPEVVRIALRKNPEVLGAAANLRATQQAYEQAAAGRFPTLDVRASGGKEESDNVALRAAGIDSRTLTRQEANVTLRQNVFDASQVRSEMDRQTFLVESARARASETAETIALRVAEAYLDSLRDQGLIGLAEENVARHEETLVKTQLRFKSGVGQRADVEQAAARVALARSNLASARGAAEDSAARYYRVSGLAPASLAQPERPSRHLPATLAAAKSEAEDKSYGIKSARLQLSAAQASVRAVRADLAPRVDVELSANRGRDIDGIIGTNNDNQLMLVMRYNLFRGGADQARVREAVERETIALETVNNAQQSTEESVSRTWAALATARSRVPSLEAHARAAQEVLGAYRDQFELGRRSLLDLVNSENELFQARSALLSGLTAERLSEYRVLAAVGGLVRALGLGDELPWNAAGETAR